MRPGLDVGLASLFHSPASSIYLACPYYDRTSPCTRPFLVVGSPRCAVVQRVRLDSPHTQPQPASAERKNAPVVDTYVMSLHTSHATCIKSLCNLIPQRLGLTFHHMFPPVPSRPPVQYHQIKANKSILSRVESLRRVVALLLTLCPACLFVCPTGPALHSAYCVHHTALAPVPTEKALLLLPHGVWLIGEAASTASVPACSSACLTVQSWR